MKKKIALIAICSLMLCGCGEVPKLKNGEEAVVSFDNEKLAVSVDSLYSAIKNRYGISIMIDMIDEAILKDKYPKVDEEKNEYIETNLKSVKANFDDDAAFIEAINYYYGFTTEDEFKNYLGLSYLRNLAVTDYAKTLVTEKESKKYYEDNIVGDIKCSHILIKVATTSDMTEDEKTAAKDKALDKAKEIIAKLKKATDVEKEFAALAKEYSQDTANAADGGNLGFFNKGEMDSAFETAAYKLEKGKYTTTPVLSSFGYHIILKTDAKAKASYDDKKEEIIEALATEKGADSLVQIDALTELRKSYGMDIQDDSLNTQYTNYIQSTISNANKTAESK